jgi:hypothetical protein
VGWMRNNGKGGKLTIVSAIAVAAYPVSWMGRVGLHGGGVSAVSIIFTSVYRMLGRDDGVVSARSTRH